MAAPSSTVSGASHPPLADLKGMLRTGVPLVGTVISSPDAVLAERVARAFDFVWIDLEHSALSIRDAQLLAIATRSGGAHALIRLPRFDSEVLTAALDMGVDGVVAPKIASAEEAERFAASVRYPPSGSRGFAPRRARATQADSDGQLDSRVAVIAQIETRGALDNLNGIAAVEGVDALVVGTNDLSLDLGHALDMSSTELSQAVVRVGETARGHEKAWGVAASSLPDWAVSARAAGAAMLVFSSDIRLYSEAIEACAGRLRRLPPAATEQR
jgi:4-hydroxy-2-oxoheptanedioate aldolase